MLFRLRAGHQVTMYAKASLDSPNQGSEPTKWYTGRELFILLFVFLAYAVAGRFNLYLVHLRPPAGSIWVPAGIALAAVLLRGRRMAPAVFLGTFVVGITASHLPLLPSLALGCGNTIEVLLASFLIEKFAGGDKAFSRPTSFLRYCLFAGALATAISAVIGAAVLYGTGATHTAGLLATFLAWWGGDALGVLAVTPFLVLILNGTHHPLHLREFGEIAVLLIGLSIVCVISFGPPSMIGDKGETWKLLCVPFLVWAAVRFCPLEAAGACLLLCGFATWGSLHGYGPFASNDQLLLPLAAYLCVVTSMTLTVAATVAGQRDVSEQMLENFYRLGQDKDFEISRLTSELEFFRDELTRRVHARSQSAKLPPKVQLPQSQPQPHLSSSDVLWFLEAETENILYVSPSYELVWGRSLEDLKHDRHAWLDAVLPQDRQYAILFVGQDFPGDRVETTYRVQRPDGTIRWIFDRGFVIRGPSGRPMRYLGVASDITEQVLQGAVVPIQLENRPSVSLQGREADNQTRRKQE